jgi:hypothetical protein
MRQFLSARITSGRSRAVKHCVAAAMRYAAA